ncbi:outer membrane beta-barrel protein [Mesonia sp. K4-1]|uniref:outer membrane beta-barrel protein n=1 Tax=Mesonia sp. K4-1 TaxID=2602760 RepID=UPI0011CCBCA3|nr:outer membrane beta-barrel protein [Mesonia sp. K4-1]TXK75811.1 PorT family protein [Mesonia sp. K4-1]
MKQFLVIIIFAFSTLAVSAQDFTYGFLVGANAYDGDISGEAISGGDGYSAFGKDGFPLNIGVFGNYQLNQSIGVKANLFYKGNYKSIRFDNVDNDYGQYVSSIQFQPLLVFDINKEYNKGFYLVGGLGVDFKLKEKTITTDFAFDEDVYKTTSLDALFGFGFTFSKSIGMEFIGNYGLSNSIALSGYETSTAGAYVNLYFNLTPLINK